MLGRVLRVESKHRNCASLCYFSNIDIFKYVTKTAHVQDKIGSTSSLMYTLVSEVHVYLKVTLIRQPSSTPTWLTQSVEHRATNLKVVGSSPTVSKNFSFCILSLSTRSWQVDWSHANEIIMTFVRGNMCIEEMII